MLRVKLREEGEMEIWGHDTTRVKNPDTAPAIHSCLNDMRSEHSSAVTLFIAGGTYYPHLASHPKP